MQDLLSKIFSFLEKHLPGLLMSFGFGYKLGQKKTHEVEKKLIKSEYEKGKLENEKIVREAHDGMSDSDIIDEAIRKGRK